MQDYNIMRNFFAHESAIIDKLSSIGEGTKFGISHIMESSRIGKNCNIGQNVVISPGVVLGNNVKSKTMFQFTRV